MYSGSDSTGSQKVNQWPLNRAAYQNTPNDEIDWAALAQQWIIMKEAGPPVPDMLFTAPPAPRISKKESVPEGGEAPMDVENEKEESTSKWPESSPNVDGSWNWNQEPHWGWNNSWPPPSGVPPPNAPKAPLLPTPPTYNQYNTAEGTSANFGGFNKQPPAEYAGYWTAAGSKMKPHNKRYSKVNVPPRPPIPPPAVVTEPVMLDASKRKQLPAWIREGLEKMERDKQKQLEKEREKLEKENQVEKSKFDEKEALEIIKSTVKERERSKFDSDSDDSNPEHNSTPKARLTPEPIVLTHEELMLKLRRTMTEILLKVTNQEIRLVCKEEYQRHVRRYEASDQRLSASSGTNVSAKLGLGIYGDSASSSNESDDDGQRNKNDSDMELKDAIKKKKAEFSKTEREIEERLAAAEKHANDDSRGGTPNMDDNESQVDAKLQGHKSKPNDNIVPEKHRKNRRNSTSSSSSKSESDYGASERKTVRSKRSSSNESNEKEKYYKNERRSDSYRKSRSRTPKKKKSKDEAKSNNRKHKHSDSSSSKSSTRSRRSRSKSIESYKRKRSKTPDKYSRGHRASRRYSRRSNSRSSSRSGHSRSRSSSGRSESGRRSRSYSRSNNSRAKPRRSRSRTRSRRSWSHDRRSRSNHSRSSRSRHRSKSYSPRWRRQRVRSRSSSRGKPSHRH